MSLQEARFIYDVPCMGCKNIVTCSDEDGVRPTGHAFQLDRYTKNPQLHPFCRWCMDGFRNTPDEKVEEEVAKAVLKNKYASSYPEGLSDEERQLIDKVVHDVMLYKAQPRRGFFQALKDFVLAQ